MVPCVSFVKPTPSIGVLRVIFVVAMSIVAATASGQLIPERLYYGVDRSVPMRVEAPEGATSVEVRMYRPGDVVQEGPPAPGQSSAPVEIASAPVRVGRIDLAALFPILWTASEPTLLYAQLVVDGDGFGSPVVISPMMTPPRVLTELEHRAVDAVRNGDRAEAARLADLPSTLVGRLGRQTHVTPPARLVYSGVRAWADRHVIVETSFGDIEVRLRPDAAPRTAWNFLHLVETGFYTDIPIHRVVADDGAGRPFIIQAGDPTGGGFGGPGYVIDFEDSLLEHDFGVLSMARRPSDPNSAGSQFFICLSRDACKGLDGQYASFAEAVDGGGVIDAISAVAVESADPDDPVAPYDRPLEMPVIKRMRAIPAPPLLEAPSRVTRAEVGPVER